MKTLPKKKPIDLVREYNARQNQVPKVSDEINPLLSQILNALSLVLQKEIPATIVQNEIKPAEIADFKVELENPVVVNVPQQDAPTVNIKSKDYTQAIVALTKAVVELKEAVVNRPRDWSVQRDKNGFIKEVNGS